MPDRDSQQVQPASQLEMLSPEEIWWLSQNAINKGAYRTAPTPEQVATAEQRFIAANNKLIAADVDHYDFEKYKFGKNHLNRSTDNDYGYYVYPRDTPDNHHNPDFNGADYAEWAESKKIVEQLWRLEADE